MFCPNSVQRLQESIEIEYQIPVDKQVLLISGGQSLDPQMRVCSYSAGTVSIIMINHFSTPSILDMGSTYSSSELWDKQPKLCIKNCLTVNQFKTCLKTHLFMSAFDN